MDAITIAYLIIISGIVGIATVAGIGITYHN
ncbi:hypothetical protein PBI_GAIA_163 [Mycobacterium phage Gaia]|uniref:Uncharacterized protein n=1 Tax=Mycobacterium phage Gaia TaxID=1486472 RepID=A0A068F2M0_9CAUD|nr:hypothetical protein VC46_gp073 [Mycobacterium phage Gaia]AID58979.1 hypothetical protein PBI_GAIA_163 [Mycobacterium phage Gaia]AYR00116.1 hypothetical protein PBI_NEBKISS_159 [Mycobacterium phage Nebkiss]